MFKGNMVTEAIPSRVYALYKIVAEKNSIKKSALQKMMEPPELRKKETGKTTTSYFSEVLKCAIELKLVEEKDNGVHCLISSEQLASINDMKVRAIKTLNEFHDTQFYKVTKTVLEMNERIFEVKSISDARFTTYLSAETGFKIDNTNMNAWRFWAEFFGFGYVLDSKTFIPNTYRFLKIILSISGFEIGKEYSFSEFLTKTNSYGSILTEANKDKYEINMAFSNGLRQMAQNKEIEFLSQNDSPENYRLYKSASFFNNPVTGIIYKGVGE